MCVCPVLGDFCLVFETFIHISFFSLVPQTLACSLFLSLGPPLFFFLFFVYLLACILLITHTYMDIGSDPLDCHQLQIACRRVGAQRSLHSGIVTG